MKDEDFKKPLVEKLKIQQVQSQFTRAPDLPKPYCKNKCVLFNDSSAPLQCVICNMMITRPKEDAQAHHIGHCSGLSRIYRTSPC